MQENFSKRESNKAQKKEAFIKAAKELFIEKGFENTSIEEIVKRAGLTKRTLYQYFQSKEDLYYAVALEGARLLFEASMAALERGDNVREKIRLTNLEHLNFYEKHFDLFQILNYIPANKENSETSPNYQQVRALDGQRMMHLASLIDSGAADGSINSGLDVKKAVIFGFFSAFSLLYTFAFTDKSIWNTLQLNEDEFLRFSFDLLAGALK
jgi:AcrR family transcriptional regulator